jgi:hypothetical protein
MGLVWPGGDIGADLAGDAVTSMVRCDNCRNGQGNFQTDPGSLAKARIVGYGW